YKRMVREYRLFWNDERLAAAKSKGLNPVEVSTLASIIDDEASKDDEKQRIAGVYLNRLRLGIPLQSDPTIKFALNDFTIKRVLYQHLKVVSPYNTYMHRGLPPGPVRCATKGAIEAVLNAEEHDYLYFVAKSDFSGYHHFSRTLAEHNRYANAYQRELNRRRIYE
ncbi:MAG: endolytic transglycosylase MltG, partial [Bacteroidales bacterium]|nr:endolytic transglycosylase MltG [Bacteroidales bacterium]